MTKVYRDPELAIPESAVRGLRLVKIPERSDTRFADTASLLEESECSAEPHITTSDPLNDAVREDVRQERSSMRMFAGVVLYTIGVLTIIACVGLYAAVKS